MRFIDSPAPLIVLVGPTGVGKTELSIRLAEKMGGEIVSADSRLFYRGMDIGTVKPAPAERRGVPHHLIDVANPDETWSLALFQKEAKAAIEAIHARGRLPLLVGGTGQYIRAVTEGWQPPAYPPNLTLRGALTSWANEIGVEALYQRLAKVDPQAAAKIEPRNMRRIVRALEVIFISGERFSEQQHKSPPPYQSVVIGLTRPRPELYHRIDARIDAMLADGFIEEVKSLLAKGYPPTLPTFSAIGYREIIDYLDGRVTLPEAVMLIRRQTREYVRRQANWFKADDPTIHWVKPGPQAAEELVDWINALNLK